GRFGRKLGACVFDNESSVLDERCRKKARARAGTADTEGSLAGHIRHVRRFAPAQPHRRGSAIDLSHQCLSHSSLTKVRHAAFSALHTSYRAALVIFVKVRAKLEFARAAS